MDQPVALSSMLGQTLLTSLNSIPRCTQGDRLSPDSGHPSAAFKSTMTSPRSLATVPTV
jgi:hypothetical protein